MEDNILKPPYSHRKKDVSVSVYVCDNCGGGSIYENRCRPFKSKNGYWMGGCGANTKEVKEDGYVQLAIRGKKRPHGAPYSFWATEIKFSKIAEGVSKPSLLKLSIKDAEQLMNSLWRAGIRVSEGHRDGQYVNCEDKEDFDAGLLRDKQ